MGNAHSSYKNKREMSFTDIHKYTNQALKNKDNIYTKEDFKEILQAIDEVNKLMHFYKSMLNLKEYSDADTYNFKTFSEKSSSFFKKYNNTLNEELSTKIKGVDIKNYYDVYVFINKINYYYQDIPKNNIRRRDFLTSIFNLLHLTLYLMIHHEFL